MIFIYRVFTTLIYPFLFIFIYYRKFLKKEHPERLDEDENKMLRKKNNRFKKKIKNMKKPWNY